MAAEFAKIDWSAHPLGPPAGWPRTLHVAVRTLLASEQPMWLGWGGDLACFYNEACLPLLATRHPGGGALGRPAAEVWGDPGARAHAAFRAGRGTRDDGLLILAVRDGEKEESYHTFSCSPVPDDHGGIGGVLCVVTDQTARFISERRLGLIRDLAAELKDVETETGVSAAVLRCLTARPEDVPIGMLYVLDPPGDRVRARLLCAHGVAAGSPLAPQELDPGDPSSVWPLGDLMAAPAELRIIEESSRWRHPLPTGVWDRPAKRVALVPIAGPAVEGIAGCLVAWINPYRPFDEAYKGFLRLLASQIGGALAGIGRRWRGDAAPIIPVAEVAQAEATLAASEEQFRTLADSIPQLAWIARPDGHITWYNKRWYEYTGTTFEQMEGWGWQSVHDPAVVPGVVARFKAALASGEAWEDTFQLRRHDGEMRWHLSQARPVRDERGRIVRWFGTNTDVTAQREAEESLRASEERFRLMADAAPTLIWLAGADRQRTWFNKRWLEFTGRSMKAELGSGWVHGVHPEDMGGALAAYLDAFEAKREFRMEYRLLRHDGAYRWMLAHGVPLHGAGGRFTGMIGVCIDITDQVHARQTLERQQVLLEEAVRMRTEELQSSNERLRLAERMASLGTLSAGLGHDMGNLLVPLRVRLESLSKASLPPELREDVDAIRSSAEYLQRLASGLRLLAIDPRRTTAGENTDLAAWWAEAGSLMKNAVPRGIEVVCRMECGECRAAVSRAALTQAIFNLVQNAGDAMRARGKGQITVWATGDRETVRVGVSDDGPGMSADIKARCMEPFFTTKPRGISTGMGLALVYGLVRDAGGSVEVESELGQGTTFVLVFKRAVESEKVGAGKRVVVLVNDLRQRALVTAELRALEFSVSTDPADTGNAALVVADDASSLPVAARGRATLLLADDPAGRQGVVALGVRPRWQAIREALRRIANEGT